MAKARIPDFKAFATSLAAEAKAIADYALGNFAKAECARFKLRIRRQQFVAFHRVPLSRAYLLWKIRNGLDERTMIATAHYVDTIQVMRRKTIRGVLYRIGFPPNARARDKDGNILPITLAFLAKLHEYGSMDARIPARPHWRPHLQAMEQRATVVRDAVARQVGLRLRKYLKPRGR